MLEVDVSLLLSTLNELKKNYSSLENTQLNLFSNLSAIVNVDWKDGNSVEFDKQIYSEKLETEKFKINIWNKISVLEYIYNKYSALLNKIKMNLSSRDNIISSVDSCITTLNSINTEFSYINTSFSYPGVYTIKEKRSLCINLKNQLISIRSDIASLYQKIENVEFDVLKKIQEIEDFIVSSFGNVTKASNVIVSGGNLIYSLFAVDEQKVEFYIKEENKCYVTLYNTVTKVSPGYKSSNTGKYINTFINYKNSYEAIFVKRKKYISILDQVPIRYDIAVTNAKDEFKGDV